MYTSSLLNGWFNTEVTRFVLKAIVEYFLFLLSRICEIDFILNFPQIFMPLVELSFMNAGKQFCFTWLFRFLLSHFLNILREHFLRLWDEGWLEFPRSVKFRTAEQLHGKSKCWEKVWTKVKDFLCKLQSYQERIMAKKGL